MREVEGSQEVNFQAGKRKREREKDRFSSAAGDSRSNEFADILQCSAAQHKGPDSCANDDVGSLLALCSSHLDLFGPFSPVPWCMQYSITVQCLTRKQAGQSKARQSTRHNSLPAGPITSSASVRQRDRETYPVEHAALVMAAGEKRERKGTHSLPLLV